MESAPEALLRIEKKYFSEYIGKDTELLDEAIIAMPGYSLTVQHHQVCHKVLKNLTVKSGFLMVDLYEALEKFGVTELKNYSGLLCLAAKVVMLEGIEFLGNEKQAKYVEYLSRFAREKRIYDASRN